MYDNIGNRESSTIDDPPATTTYTSNQLNQYSSTSSPAETFLYDEGGNMESDGSYTYEWDAENRLSVVWLVDPTSGTDEDGDRKLEFTYDYMGRRVRKQDSTHNGTSWVESLDHSFVYDGWNVLLELDENNSDAILRKYTWGLDLSGSFQGAGGIGGLLAMHEPGAPAEEYIYLYDANGNVGQLVAWADGYGAATAGEWHLDRLVAHYEYDPYGGVTVSAGAYASENPFRFSTKYWDDESGFGYWGYRYYSARLGRWLKRDPIAELGGHGLYRYGANRPVSALDILGLSCGPWQSTNTPVRMKRKQWFRRGSVNNRDPGTRWEIDYQILKAGAKLVLLVVGKGPDGTPDSGEIPLWTAPSYWTVPYPSQFVLGGTTAEGKPINMLGVGCRVLERCVRECKRCCRKRHGLLGLTSTKWWQIGCVGCDESDATPFPQPGAKAQWKYGTLVKPGTKSASGQWKCNLYPTGARTYPTTS